MTTRLLQHIHDVHVFSWGTDVLLLALRRVPKLDKNSAVIIGTGEHSRKVMLKPIYMTN